MEGSGQKCSGPVLVFMRDGIMGIRETLVPPNLNTATDETAKRVYVLLS